MSIEESKDINIEDSFSKEAKVVIDEGARLDLAKKILAVIGFICIATFVAYAFLPENPALQAIFELIKIGALPLVTLVISFYFPSSSS